MKKNLKKHFTSFVLLVSLFIIGIVYIYFTITPSHYGVILNEFLGLDYQPLAGQARSIRGDEYSVVTPYFQIAVNNDFQRFNQTSPYGEDLRQFVGLPLQDWAIVFKPYMWGFWVFEAARAFSLYHYFMIVAFLIGITLFLNRLKLPIGYSAIIAAILFFSHHNQAWWSSNAPVLALTVWIILPFLYKWSYPIKFIATFYISMMALLALIYPVWQISLIYVFVFLALAFRRDSFRIANMTICALGFIAACGLSYYYLQDIIPLMQNTIYPGTKAYSGGSAARYFLWAQLAPHALIQSLFKPIINFGVMNINEVSTVSSLLLTFNLSFFDYRLITRNFRKNLWKYSISLVLLLIILGWMFLPIPSTIGQFLLLDKLGPHRLLLALGTYTVFLSAFITFYAKWVFSWLRLVIYSAVISVIPIIIYRNQHNTIDLMKSFDVYDFIAISIALLLLATKLLSNQFFTKPKQVAYSLALIALLYNILSFSHFNPLQDAKDIFSKELLSKTSRLKAELNLSPENLVAYQGPKAISAALNGLGLPTLNHALMVPQLEYYKEIYPELNDKEFTRIFNRFAKVGTVDTFDKPTVVADDLIGVPGQSAATTIAFEASNLSLLERQAQTQRVYVKALEWSDVNVTKRLLRIDFYNPIIFDVTSAGVSANFSDVLQNAIERQEVTVATSLIAKPNLTNFLSDQNSHIEAITIWQLFIEFSSQDLDTLIQLPENLNNLYIQDSESKRLLYPIDNLQVESIAENQLSPEETTRIPHGFIDKVYYDVETQALEISGWTPVEDIPSARWFGYLSSHKLKLNDAISYIRSDVPLIHGRDLSKGFRLRFSLSDADNNNPLRLCIYSATKGLGVFPIHAADPKLRCFVVGVVEKLQDPIVAQTILGKIDVANFDEVQQTLTIKGWAPRNQVDEAVNKERLFRYFSDLDLTIVKANSFERPDVAKVYGDTLANSGFEIILKPKGNSKMDFPIIFCLYGNDNELGGFRIPSDKESPMLTCND